MKLHTIDPGYVDPDVSEQDALAHLKKLCKKLRKLQAALYSEKQRSVLIVLQALDTGGKDGVINHVLGTMNPLGCRPNGQTDNDTHVLEFFLHVSKEEQLRRFERRLDDPKRHWKISDADYKERKFWDAYTDCKWFRNLAVAQIVVDHLEKLQIQPPQPTVDLGAIRREYEQAAAEAAGKPR